MQPPNKILNKNYLSYQIITYAFKIIITVSLYKTMHVNLVRFCVGLVLKTLNLILPKIQPIE